METHWNTTEVDTMPHRWPADTDFRFWELDVLDRDCASCGRMMHICDHRYRHFYTLEGPVELVCKLNHCPNPDCPGHAKTKSPEMEATIALPAWAIGWDVFCWIGHRRFARHWSIPQIRHELIDSYAIELTEPCIALYVQRYQTMLAARQQDFEAMRRQYEGVDDIILTIDGLQPEKGHETITGYCLGRRFLTRGSYRPGRRGLTTSSGISSPSSAPRNHLSASMKLTRSASTP